MRNVNECPQTFAKVLNWFIKMCVFNALVIEIFDFLKHNLLI